MNIYLCMFCLVVSVAGSEKPTDESQIELSRTPKQLFPIYFSVALITVTLTIPTTITTVSTSSTTCTVSTNVACSGKRKRSAFDLDDELIPSPVLSVEPTEAAKLDNVRDARSPQWYYDHLYDPQPTLDHPAMMHPQRPHLNPFFRTSPHLITEESEEDVNDDRQPRILLTTTQRYVTYYSSTTTTTVKSTPTCSTLTGFSTC